MAEAPTEKAQLVEVCRYLRTKSAYLPGEDAQRALAEPSDTSIYWCNRTGGAMGPDQDITGPAVCDGQRTCYVAAQLVLHGPRSDRE